MLVVSGSFSASFPDMLLRIEFWGIGREVQCTRVAIQLDPLRYLAAAMPAAVVPDEQQFLGRVDFSELL